MEKRGVIEVDHNLKPNYEEISEVEKWSWSKIKQVDGQVDR